MDVDKEFPIRAKMPRTPRMDEKPPGFLFLLGALGSLALLARIFSVLDATSPPEDR